MRWGSWEAWFAAIVRQRESHSLRMLSGLRMLTLRDFTTPRHRLPVASFTALWKLVTAAAEKCSPDLRQLFDADGARGKMQAERQNAPENLRVALSRISDQPDRAAQLAEAAMSASDPTVLNIASLTLFLTRLRDRAPDVSDELFPDVLSFIAGAHDPNPDHLLELGKYLFTARKYVDQDDKNQQSDVHQVSGTPVANFEANRRSSSTDDIHDYIDAVVKVLSTENLNYNPVAAYAIAYQMVQRAEDLAPELTDSLRQLLSRIEQMPGAHADQVRSAVSGSGAADPKGGEGPRARDRLVGRVLASAHGGRFAEAREVLQSVDDQDMRSQVKLLIDFAEAGAAMGKGDLQWAFTLSHALPPGVKRTLVYAGIAAHARSRQEATDYFQLALKDVEMLPAEQQMMTLAALAEVMLRAEPESGYLAQSLLVKAANDAYTHPHSGRFDPEAARKIFSDKATTFTDSAFILANRRHTAEIVDTGLSRYSFSLQVPGVSSRQLTDVLRGAREVDWLRLEATVLGLRDETPMAAGVNALVAGELAGR